MSEVLNFRNRGNGHEVEVDGEWILVGKLVQELSAKDQELAELRALLGECRSNMNGLSAEKWGSLSSRIAAALGGR